MSAGDGLGHHRRGVGGARAVAALAPAGARVRVHVRRLPLPCRWRQARRAQHGRSRGQSPTTWPGAGRGLWMQGNRGRATGWACSTSCASAASGRAVREHGRRVRAVTACARHIPDAVAQRCLVHPGAQLLPVRPVQGHTGVLPRRPGLLQRAVAFPRAGRRSPASQAWKGALPGAVATWERSMARSSGCSPAAPTSGHAIHRAPSRA